MFSDKIYTDIVRLTQQALRELHSLKAIDQVTAIQGYVQLSPRLPADYDARLRNSIERLLDLARGEKQRQLTEALEALLKAMDQEHAA